jgi:hypothetical protein
VIKHKHHIIPRHAGGTDEESNLAWLTVEEHAEAHRLLFEKYGRWEDEVAWKGLAGLIDKAEIVRIVQSKAALDMLDRNGNPWEGRRTSANWAENPELRKKASDAAVSQEANDKRINTMLMNNHQQGEKNSRFGKSLYENSDGTRKYFVRGQEPEGWILRSVVLETKKNKSKAAYGRSWYNDGTKNFFLKHDDPLVMELNLEKRRITA